MDRRSWPWKKKSSSKTAAAEPVLDSATSLSDPLGSQIQQVKKEGYKKTKYVQISVETYSHFIGLEDQVKSYEEQVTTLEAEIKDLNEKLLESETEMTNKENLVKQHGKVAEEAVSGWEKTEAEAAALKTHLESVTLLKLTAEDRASHLDGSLKECMRQIGNLKEEHEQELHDVVFTKTKQIDELKRELESRIAALDQELLMSTAENAALSRSLQDYSGMIIKLNQEKSQAEAEIQDQKSTIESNQKEINSLKYEVHIVTKEMEIRNEEKNMSVRSAEVANKQHLEGVKKIARLEAECQRLRGLVRKKLPGPAALAQMKLEAENLCRDQGDTRFRRSLVKPPTHYPTSLPELSPDIMQKYNRENDLSERLLAMEEETKMLKEALAKRNSELQASRSICAKTTSKLRILEAQVQSSVEDSSPPKLNNHLSLDGSLSLTASRPPSMTSLSVDASDDEASCAGSCATPSVSEISYFKKEKKMNSHGMSENSRHLGLMDDFLEMEKLAYQSNGSNAALPSSGIKNDERIVSVENGASREVINEEDSATQEIHASYSSMSQVNCERDVLGHPEINESPAAKLQFRLTSIIDSLSMDQDISKALEDLRFILQETYKKSCHQSVSCVAEASNFLPGDFHCKNDANLAAEKDIVLSHGSEHLSKTSVSISQELTAAISRIYEFVMVLANEAKTVQGTSFDSDGLSQQMEQLSTTYEEVVNMKTSLVQFVFDLSHLMGKADELQFKVMGYKVSEAEASNSDCIDKVALPENKASFGPSGDRCPNSCSQFSDTNSDADIPHESPARTSPPPADLWECSLEEFERLKSEKDSLVINLAACTEQLNNTKIQLQETAQHLAEVKSQLTSAQKINGLSETQLKCMAESYNNLETRSEELQAEVNHLSIKTDALESELQEEKKSFQQALSRCKDLEDQLHRMESCPSADFDAKTSQEKELSAAAEKLAECQETIFLLGRQLNSLRPQAELPVSPESARSKDEGFYNEPPCNSNTNWEDTTDQPESDLTPCTPVHKAGRQSSPAYVHDMQQSPDDCQGNDVYLSSPTSLKHPKHRQTKSALSSSSSPTPEKHARGLSRFFSSKN